MKRIESKEALIKMFRDLDQKTLFIPPQFNFPMGLSQSLSWTEPNGKRSFLIFEDRESGKVLGVQFERSYGAGESRVSMCDWCHRVGSTADVHLYTAKVNNTNTVGSFVCEGLNCFDRIDALPSKNSMPETLGTQDKIERIRDRINRFIKSNLF